MTRREQWQQQDRDWQAQRQQLREDALLKHQWRALMAEDSGVERITMPDRFFLQDLKQLRSR